MSVSYFYMRALLLATTRGRGGRLFVGTVLTFGAVTHRKRQRDGLVVDQRKIETVGRQGKKTTMDWTEGTVELGLFRRPWWCCKS